MNFERSIDFNRIQNILIRGSSSAVNLLVLITADEDPRIEMFCILLKSILHSKLINLHFIVIVSASESSLLGKASPQ